MSGEVKISDGFSKSFRKELQSDVWIMPPIYHRVWYWLRMKVQHEPYLFPVPGKYGIWVLPGQRVTSLQQIAEGVAWCEWGVRKTPNKKTIKSVLDWLEAHEMVTVVSNTKGTLINLTNWHIYNNDKKLKVTARSDAKGTRSGHKEEPKEPKELKELKTSCPKPKKNPASDRPSFDFSSGTFDNLHAFIPHWETAYPAINIISEIKKSAAWLISNPKNRKSNYLRFLNGWLSRAQDSAARIGNYQQLPSADTTIPEYMIDPCYQEAANVN